MFDIPINQMSVSIDSKVELKRKILRRLSQVQNCQLGVFPPIKN
jgi:hypothetical protein